MAESVTYGLQGILRSIYLEMANHRHFSEDGGSGARCQATIAHRSGAGVYVARVESAWLCFGNIVAAGEGLHLMLQCCDVAMLRCLSRMN